MKHAFSLVELSIVLVILGLLTGGILTGQSLIRAAELRSVTTEYQNFQTVTMTFRDKYFALPGDMRNATAFWGAADSGDGVGSDCFYTESTGSETCNGDGSGTLESNTAVSFENFRYWQHLANAGLIEGSYTGAPTATISPGNRYASIGVNIPSSKLGQAAWYIHTLGTVTSPTSFLWQGSYGNVMIFGGVEPTDITEVPELVPEEAWNIDKKIDDGVPSSGSVLPYRTAPNCVTSMDVTNPAAAEYDFAVSGKGCLLIFKIN